MQPTDVHVLHFLHGKYAGEEYPLGPDESYIAGRSPEADIVLADDTVSRKHARFYRSRDLVWVRDLGSRNGTRVGGQPVGDTPAAWSEGTPLHLGKTCIITWTRGEPR